MSKADECVKVVVRVRPMSSDEERNGNLMYDNNYDLLRLLIDSILFIFLLVLLRHIPTLV